jgi:hypothetical protein
MDRRNEMYSFIVWYRLKESSHACSSPAQIQETCGCRGFGWLTGPSAIMQQALFGFSGNSLNLGMTAMAAMQTCDVHTCRLAPGVAGNARQKPAMRMPGSGRGHGEDKTTESMSSIVEQKRPACRVWFDYFRSR